MKKIKIGTVVTLTALLSFSLMLCLAGIAEAKGGYHFYRKKTNRQKPPEKRKVKGRNISPTPTVTGTLMRGLV